MTAAFFASCRDSFAFPSSSTTGNVFIMDNQEEVGRGTNAVFFGGAYPVGRILVNNCSTEKM